MLLGAGVYFVLVALSYVEGTTSIRETGGAATFVRKAFNDLAGFVTGWALFLDYLIVIALSTLFVPHYLGAAFGFDTLRESPWDTVVAVLAIAAIVAYRLLRRSRLYRAVVAVAVVDLGTQVMLVGLGFALIYSPDALEAGTELGVAPTWHSIAFALPLALLAYTGLETVANLAEETRRPGRTLPRSLFAAIGLTVALYTRDRPRRALRLPGREPRERARRRLAARAADGSRGRATAELPAVLGDALRVYVGPHRRADPAHRGDDVDLRLRPARVLARRARPAAAGVRPPAPAHARRAAGDRRGRRRVAITLIAVDVLRDDPVVTLARLYSFGVLLAFSAAQLAVIRLRITQPELRRPFRVPFGVRVRGADVPVPSLVGFVLTLAVMVVALGTHPGARYAGPLWLAAGVVVYVVVRRPHGERLTAERGPTRRAAPAGDALPAHPRADEARRYRRGDGRDGGPDRAESAALVEVALRDPRAARAPARRGRRRRRRARGRVARRGAPLGDDHGVHIDGELVRARSIGQAIVDEARAAAGRPDRARLLAALAPAVALLLADGRLRAPPRAAEVLIVAFPQGALEEA